jgi:hypothetical protein
MAIVRPFGLPSEKAIDTPGGVTYRVRRTPAGVQRYAALGGSAMLLGWIVSWLRFLFLRAKSWNVEVLAGDRCSVQYPPVWTESYATVASAEQRAREIVDGVRSGVLPWEDAATG